MLKIDDFNVSSQRLATFWIFFEMKIKVIMLIVVISLLHSVYYKQMIFVINKHFQKLLCGCLFYFISLSHTCRTV